MIAFSNFTWRTLLVEDNPVSAQFALRSLAELGIVADHVASGQEALERHHAEPYRIVISDWIMPGIDGADLCRNLRLIDGPYVYFLLCSSLSDRSRRLEAYDAGVDDFLAKPLDRDDLGARLTVADRILAAEDRIASHIEEAERNARETAELNESLKAASRRFEDLFGGIPVACFTFDASGGIHEWNRAAEEAFGVPAFDTLLRPVWDVLGSSGGVWTPERCAAAFAGCGHEEFEWTHREGEAAREFSCRIIILRGKTGQAVGAVCANIDMTAHKRAQRLLASQKATLENANARLHDLASKDSLTGLWNRRAFITELKGALAEYARIGKTFSLVLIDIDKFKSYNDTFGHPAGDEVLRRFARVLRMTARSYEQPSRYGGEEFAIVLHNTGAEKALAAAERFRKAVEDGDWIERPVTCSLGVATVSEGQTAEALVAAADAALYASKANGRNRCSHADGIELCLAP